MIFFRGYILTHGRMSFKSSRRWMIALTWARPLLSDSSSSIRMWKSWLKLYVYVYSTPSDEVLTRLQFLSLSKGHGIEGAFLLGGKVIDQDHGLAAVYTTPGAEGVSTSSLQSSTILTNLNCSFSVNTAELIPMKSLPVSRHMYSEYLIDSWVPSADLFSSNQASLDEVTEAFGDGDQETGIGNWHSNV